MRRLLKWTAFGLLALVALAVVTAAFAGLWLHGRLTASLPQLEGERIVPGLGASVTIERDDLGVPTIRAANRSDVASAIGFLHGQERFFQMDLLRRGAAGELAALLGPLAVGADRALRVHGFRRVAERNVQSLTREERELLMAYTTGVNAGLISLGAPPPEYVLLRSQPQPWTPEDSMLVVAAMYLDLQSDLHAREQQLGLMHDLLPQALFDFLTPAGTPWDAPLTGEVMSVPAVPGPEVLDLRLRAPARMREEAHSGSTPIPQQPSGSNAAAVAGSHAAGGAALLANDMHLGLSLPNIWYRARFIWTDESGAGEAHQVTGLTLPGAAVMITGSNGHIAWGFTNSQGDWADLILLEIDPHDSDIYLTPQGPRRLERRQERISIKGQHDEIADVTSTVWGPVIDQDHRGRWRALRWAAHDPGSANLGLVRLERARELEAALRAAAEMRIPTQNIIVADRTGRIGWTLAGGIPRRLGCDGRLPQSWTSGECGWDGTLAPQEYPLVVDPPWGRIWSANNRHVDGEMLEKIGDGGFDLGARAQQIRDRLLSLERATARDLLAVQLDDRARFLEPWRELLLGALTPEALRGKPDRAEFRRLVEENWTGRAAVDSAGYRLVRAFRILLAEQVFAAITAACAAADRRFNYLKFEQWEGPLWRLVTERPPHLLDPRHASWEAQLLAAVDAVLEQLLPQGEERHGAPLAARTWGERNQVRIQHPLSRAVPVLGRWLDIVPESLPGDANMPRVQAQAFGASARMVVAPGFEQEGLCHMPGGQSGHPLSPYYREGHRAWARGEATPFLPGSTAHRLTLRPAP